jgi:hypothetical protein
MTISHLPVEPAEPPAREPWPGEGEALAEAAAAGRRAADWIRTLPAPETDRWIVGPLADAVQEALEDLDPADCDDLGHEGAAGVDESVRERLDSMIYAVPESAVWLTPEQQTRLLAIVACASGIPRLIANDPGGTIESGWIARMCAVLDHASGA